MSLDNHYDVDAALDKALKDDFLRKATRRATDRLRNNKLAITEELGNWEEWRQVGERIRNHVVENLDYYLDMLIENVEKNGGHVHLAKTPEDGVRIVQKIFQKHGFKSVIKSKSMITEEIHLNPVLEKDGIEVVETDLAEYNIQIADEPTSHIIVPAMHKTREQIAKLFEPIAGHPL
ncbi:MAG: LUD domain-containing protein, partial [Desulfitobacterium hafniense]